MLFFDYSLKSASVPPKRLEELNAICRDDVIVTTRWRESQFIVCNSDDHDEFVIEFYTCSMLISSTYLWFYFSLVLFAHSQFKEVCADIVCTYTP